MRATFDTLSAPIVLGAIGAQARNLALAASHLGVPEELCVKIEPETGPAEVAAQLCSRLSGPPEVRFPFFFSRNLIFDLF